MWPLLVGLNNYIIVLLSYIGFPCFIEFSFFYKSLYNWLPSPICCASFLHNYLSFDQQYQQLSNILLSSYMRILWCDQENTTKDKWKFQLYSWQLLLIIWEVLCVALERELQTVISKRNNRDNLLQKVMWILRESQNG